MTIRTLTLSAAAVALALGAGSAVAGMKTLISDVWQPGYYVDDNNRYVKVIHTDDNTGYNAGRTIGLARSDVWQPGFQIEESGIYVMQTDDTDISGFATAAGAEPALKTLDRRDTWAPGYRLEDENGHYVRD